MGNQQEYLEKYKEESLKQLNPEHFDVVINFLKTNSQINPHYMITISRDGESPARSIYHFPNAIEAVENYNKYTDWGFAKNYLTVTLYGPGGKLSEKVLKRPLGGSRDNIRFDVSRFFRECQCEEVFE